MRQTALNFWYIVIPDPEAHMLLGGGPERRFCVIRLM
jgi:hypothetical protein